MNKQILIEPGFLSDIITSEIISGEIIPLDPVLVPGDSFPAIKRFGIIDIWKIHAGKRSANVYPRRV